MKSRIESEIERIEEWISRIDDMQSTHTGVLLRLLKKFYFLSQEVEELRKEVEELRNIIQKPLKTA